MSNYDPRSIKFSDMSRSSTIDDDETNTSELERVIATYHRVHPGIHHSSFRVPPSVTEEDNGVVVEEGGQEPPLQRAEVDLLQTPQPYGSTIQSLLDEEQEEEPDLMPVTWSTTLFLDAYDELVFRGRHFLMNSLYQNDESFAEKVMVILELPFVAARTVEFI